MNKKPGTLPSIVSCMLCLPMPPPSAAAEERKAEVVKLDAVVVVGSRVPGRPVHASPVPADVLPGHTFRNYGVRDMDAFLAATVPSYNVNQQSINDAPTLVRPANLRGLPPDSLLILVNGKRRHRSSVITFLGGGISDGAHATDLAAILAIALKRVEVLRDGASSNLAANLGVPPSLPFVQYGFANFSFKYNKTDPTSRSVQRDDAQALRDAGNTHVRQPYAQIWGAPEVHYDYKLFGNLGAKLNRRTELYGWGNYAQRKIEGGVFYRNPNTRGGCSPKRGGKPCSWLTCRTMAEAVLPIPTNAAADYGNVSLPSHCFMFNEKFSGGFTQTFGGTVHDWSGAVGLRGMLAHANVWLDDWHDDLSVALGQHSTDFFMRNTINPQLAGLRTNVPKTYKPGVCKETDRVFNGDLARSLDTALFASPLNLGLGLQYRTEACEIKAGEEQSWFIDDQLAAQGFGIGSNGFPGFQPAAAGKNDRNSYAACVDLETTVALRGELSTGFRAQIVGQANVRNVTTEFVGGRLADPAALPPTHPAARFLGRQALKPETSFNISAGTVVKVGKLAVTLAYYRTQVQDRIAQTKDLVLCDRGASRSKLINVLRRSGNCGRWVPATTSGASRPSSTSPTILTPPRKGSTSWRPTR